MVGTWQMKCHITLGECDGKQNDQGRNLHPPESDSTIQGDR